MFRRQGKSAVEQAEQAFQEQAEKVTDAAQDTLERGAQANKEDQLNAFDNTIKARSSWLAQGSWATPKLVGH